MTKATGNRRVDATFKAMCSERWQSEKGWGPQCTMGDVKWLAVLLLFAFVFQLVSFCTGLLSEWRVDGVICSLLGFMCVCVFAARTYSNLGAHWAEMSSVGMDLICHSLGFLVTWWWTTTQMFKNKKEGRCNHATAYFDHRVVSDYQQGLAQANWDEAILVLILLHKRDKMLKCLCAFWFSSINNIYWKCKLPLSMLHTNLFHSHHCICHHGF